MGLYIQAGDLMGWIKPRNESNFTLEELQEYLRTDTVEVLYLPSGYLLVMDEHGQHKNRPLNPLATAIAARPIVGNVLLVAHTEMVEDEEE